MHCQYQCHQKRSSRKGQGLLDASYLSEIRRALYREFPTASDTKGNCQLHLCSCLWSRGSSKVLCFFSSIQVRTYEPDCSGHKSSWVRHPLLSCSCLAIFTQRYQHRQMRSCVNVSNKKTQSQLVVIDTGGMDRVLDCWYLTLLKRRTAKLMRKPIGR